MTSLQPILDAFFRWVDAVAVSIIAMVGWLTSLRAVRLIEEEPGTLVVEGGGPSGSEERIRVVDGQVVGMPSDKAAAMLRGSRAEIFVQTSRFLFRPLELPKRASEFLDGIVRSQNDRLTPWSAGEAVFGWGKPEDVGPDRMVVTVAATARALLARYLQALASLGGKSIEVSTVLPGPDAVVVKVLDEKGHHALDVQRVRRVLVAVLLVAALGAVVASVGGTLLGRTLEAKQDQLARQIASRRAAALGGREGSLDAATAALRTLERRKFDNPSAVLVLEQLSQLLPDHTYVTEMRIEGDKLRLVGITRDAPSLIGLMEQTQHFTRATFFAPTTRSPNEPGERFHIEAHIEPSFPARS